MNYLVERYYLDWGVDPTEEASKEEAVSSGDFTRALFDESGKLGLTELYSDGELFHIDYRSHDTSKTKARHLQYRSGVPFGVEHDLKISDIYTWRISRRFSGNGEHVGNLLRLVDSNENECMKLACTPQGEITNIEKAAYDVTGELLYLFEYGMNNDISYVFNAIDGEKTPQDEALANVDMPDFYRTGISLPPGVNRNELPMPRSEI